MGDCRLQFFLSHQVLQTLVEKNEKRIVCADDTSSSIIHENHDIIKCTFPKFYVINKYWSADTTIREVTETTLSIEYNTRSSSISSTTGSTGSDTVTDDCTTRIDFTIVQLIETLSIQLFDCTTHPPKNITDWPLTIYNEKYGMTSKCKTIYDAGWYPSGTLQLLVNDDEYHISNIYDDNNEYSTNTNTNTTTVIPNTNQQQKVELINQQSTSILPSQLIKNVLNQIGDATVNNNSIINDNEETIQAQKERRRIQQTHQQKEQHRFIRLETKIHKLKTSSSSSNSKNKKISNQVRNMLLKNRCTGRTDLQIQDRIYFHCFIVDVADDVDDADVTTGSTTDSSMDTDNNNSINHQTTNFVIEDYKYFSKQDTISRILDSFLSYRKNDTYVSELLIEVHQKNQQQQQQQQPQQQPEMNDHDLEITFASSTPSYRRLPPMLRLYEAISSDYLQDSNEIIIRFYNPFTQEMTTTINDDNVDSTNTTTTSTSTTTLINETISLQKHQAIIENIIVQQTDSTIMLAFEKEDTSIVASAVEITSDVSMDDGQDSIQRITDLVQQLDEEIARKSSSKNNKKPMSATAIKVYQMQMKSKAIGDVKRIKNIVDRFFFELVTIYDTNNNNNTNTTIDDTTTTKQIILPKSTIQFCFLARNDPIQRIIRDCCSPGLPSSSLTQLQQQSNISVQYELYKPILQNNDQHQQLLSYEKLTDTTITMTFADAEKQNILNCYQRIICYISLR